MKKTKKQIKQEFQSNRTSWTYFETRINGHMDMKTITGIKFLELSLQNQILKELQYLNDK